MCCIMPKYNFMPVSYSDTTCMTVDDDFQRRISPCLDSKQWRHSWLTHQFTINFWFQLKSNQLFDFRKWWWFSVALYILPQRSSRVSGEKTVGHTGREMTTHTQILQVIKAILGKSKGYLLACWRNRCMENSLNCTESFYFSTKV